MGNALSEVVRYKDLLRLLVTTNIKTRYKRSVLGVAWTLLSPLLTMIVMSIAFSALFRFQIENYPVYVLSGLLFYGFFQESTLQSMTSLVWGSALLKKVYVPAAVFPISAVGTGLVNFGLALIPLFVIMIFLGPTPNLALVFVPVGALMTAMFALGVGLLISSVAVFFTDVVEMYGVVVRIMFYLTPVMYPEEIVPERFLWLIRMNPLYHFLACFRDPIMYGALPASGTLATGALWAIGTLVAGWWVFSRQAHQFALRT